MSYEDAIDFMRGVNEKWAQAYHQAWLREKVMVGALTTIARPAGGGCCKRQAQAEQALESIRKMKRKAGEDVR